MAGISNASSLNKEIFKAYDIRGQYPTEISAAQVRVVAGRLMVQLKPKKVVLGKDARLSSPELYGELKKVFKKSRVSLLKLGLTTTPAFYFAVNKSGADLGLMVTASHNPKEYNGLKIVGKKAIPMSGKEVWKIINSH